MHSASVIKWQIEYSSVFHENCYYKIQINKESFIQYIYLLFIYLLLLFSYLCIHSSDVNKNTRSVRISKMSFVE